MTNEPPTSPQPPAGNQPPATAGPPVAVEPPSNGQPSPASFDVAATLRHLRRLVSLDFDVFDDLRDDRTQTFAAIVVAVVAILLAGIGGWIWVEGQLGSAVSTGQTLWRLVLVGTVLTTLFWGVWLLVAQTILQKGFGLTTDRWTIVRTSGYAAAPAALMGLVLIQLDALVFAIALIALVSWVALAELALRAAVPEARPTQIMRANLAGFFVFAVLVSISAFNWGFAGGPFLFAGGMENYFRGFSSAGLDFQPSAYPSNGAAAVSAGSSGAAADAVEQFIVVLEEVADELSDVQTAEDADQIAADAPEIIAALSNISKDLLTFTTEELALATDQHEARFEKVANRLDAELARIEAIEGVDQSSFGLLIGQAFANFELP